MELSEVPIQLEVKQGFRRSEAGLIPAEWETRKVLEFASMRTGPFGTALHKSDYTTNGIPIINPMHIVDGKLQPNSMMTITDSAALQLAPFRLKEGDIVMGRRGDMGRCAVVTADQAGWMCGTGSLIIRCKEEADPSFMQRVLSSPRIIAQMTEASVGTTMVNLNQGTMGRLHVQFPPLPEQRAIATALSDMDGLLAGLDALIAKKKALKQGAMQQLLTGKQRLPGFKGEWVVRRLGDVAEVAMGHSPLSENYNRTGIGLPLVQGNADIIDRRSISRVWTTQITRACDEGDLIMTVRAPVGAVAIASTRSCIGRGVCALRASSADQMFLYHLLVFSEANWRILEQGSTFTSANSNQVREFELLVPPTTAEQAAIAEVLSDMDAELGALEARRAKTALLKQGMMQELLTGRVRLV